MNNESVRQNITVIVNSLEDSTLCVDVVSFFFSSSYFFVCGIDYLFSPTFHISLCIYLTCSRPVPISFEHLYILVSFILLCIFGGILQ